MSKKIEQQTRTQYIVKTKIRKEPDKWFATITHNSRTGKLMYSQEEAEYEIERIKRENVYAKRKGFTTSSVGGIGFDVAHYSEYDIIGYCILKRDVTPYEMVYEEKVDD